jgi:hypothetical protein
MIKANKLELSSVAEIGCGAGGILSAMHAQMPDNIEFSGYEIAPAAMALAKRKEKDRLSFHLDDLLQRPETFDILLIIDVLEHIPCHYSFANACRHKAKYKIYHIPLEINLLSVLRASFAFTLDSGRNEVGHLHFFTAEYALMALRETGPRIIDVAFTNGGIALGALDPSWRRTIANVPRRLVSAISPPWAARLLGGFSLLVLCE